MSDMIDFEESFGYKPEQILHERRFHDKDAEKVLYRFEDGHKIGTVDLDSYEVIRETPKCYVIKDTMRGKSDPITGQWMPADKFILKDSDKAFAYITKELAARSYRIRKIKGQGWIKARLEKFVAGQEAIETLYPDLKGKPLRYSLDS
jgi:hypothetical protein